MVGLDAMISKIESVTEKLRMWLYQCLLWLWCVYELWMTIDNSMLVMCWCAHIVIYIDISWFNRCLVNVMYIYVLNYLILIVLLLLSCWVLGTGILLGLIPHRGQGWERNVPKWPSRGRGDFPLRGMRVVGQSSMGNSPCHLYASRWWC